MGARHADQPLAIEGGEGRRVEMAGAPAEQRQRAERVAVLWEREERAMQIRRDVHPWVVDAAGAVAIQRALRADVDLTNRVRLEDVRTIAGVDGSYGEEARAAVVVLSFPELQVLDQAIAHRGAVFPYVPGLLSFREVPIVLAALEKVRVQPDLIMVDGQGYAHPRRLGLASHLGLWLDVPTVGCAKSRLVGRYAEPGSQPGDRSPLVDRGETIGVVLRSKARTNPLFISAGNRIDLPTAVQVVERCLRGYRLPEPTRLADKLSKARLGAEEHARLEAMRAPLEEGLAGQQRLFDSPG